MIDLFCNNICIIYLKFCYDFDAKILIEKRLQNIYIKSSTFFFVTSNHCKSYRKKLCVYLYDLCRIKIDKLNE